MPRHDQLCVGVDRGPRPQVANAVRTALLEWQVSFFCVAVRSNLVALNALRVEAANRLVLVHVAGIAHVGQEAKYGFLVHPANAGRATDRIALYQSGEDANASSILKRFML